MPGGLIPQDHYPSLPQSYFDEIDRRAKGSAIQDVAAMTAGQTAETTTDDSVIDFGLSHGMKRAPTQRDRIETETPFGEAERRKFAEHHAGAIGIRGTTGIDPFLYWQ
jgi:hypothetical protein